MRATGIRQSRFQSHLYARYDVSRKRSVPSHRRKSAQENVQPAQILRREPFAILVAATVFLSAFLLFQVQPLICKAVLHWFGGTPAVWTASMFFFQVVLLLGYLYTDFTTRYLTSRWQMLLHVGLVVFAILLLPIQPSESWKPLGFDSHPTWRLLGLLTTAVGAQFFLLSTTAPLLQVWWHRVYGAAPYKLYALSNAGSFLALLSFPFIVEPTMGVRQQILGWSGAFFLLACSLAYCAYRSNVATLGDVILESDDAEPAPGWKQILIWLLLSMTGSVLLLAMTSHLTQNVAVVPFLWVAPLALYLLSFILSFAGTSFYRRELFGGVMIVTHVWAARLYYVDIAGLRVLLAVYLLAVFSGCMVCHGELARLKPAAKYLTFYFVIMAAGGALGGLLVSVIAPAIFGNYYEYPIVLIACWAILLTALFRDKASFLYAGKPLWAWAAIMIACLYFLSFLSTGVIRQAKFSFLSRRNFYGVLSVRPRRDGDRNQLRLMHGTIKHGVQNLDEGYQDEPTSYYSRDSGLGYTMQFLQTRTPKRVGLLGLGIGTIAAYSGNGDYFRAYEINPDVIELALDQRVFSFWKLIEERGGTSDIVVGDARISLENELRRGQPQNFDLLVLDVFSGDAIPVHLLTVEAFENYVRHLANDGILAVHISNRYLDLLPVVHSLGHRCSLTAAIVATAQSRWVILGKKQSIISLAKQHAQDVGVLYPPSEPLLWTDDFSDLLSVIK